MVLLNRMVLSSYDEPSAYQSPHEPIMNIHTIVFPTDFSQYNQAALEFASRLAAESGATLHIVYVHDVRELNAAGDAAYTMAANWEEEQAAAETRIKSIGPTIPTVKVERHCLTGTPEAELVDFAKEKNADLIVMASHGRTGLSRLLMGSVAEAVMRRATCPVLIVKQPAKE